jgi:hypothetical protein
LSDWSAIIAPTLVLTELRDMVSYPIYSKCYACPAFLRVGVHFAPPVLTVDEVETDFIITPAGT